MADVDRAFAVATRIRTGNVTINGKSHFGVASPFGGTKQSGLGYRNGAQGYTEYLHIKTIGMPAWRSIVNGGCSLGWHSARQLVVAVLLS